jgi:hypothetical protein
MADTPPPLEALTSLSRTHRSLHEERVKREFALVIAMVTFYTAAIALRYSAAEKLPLDNWIFRLGAVLYFGVLACAAGIYLHGSARANDYNQRIAENAEDKIVEILSSAGINLLHEVQRPTVTKDSTEEVRKHPNRYRWRWQISIVVFAAIFAAIAFTVVPCTPVAAG